MLITQLLFLMSASACQTFTKVTWRGLPYRRQAGLPKKYTVGVLLMYPSPNRKRGNQVTQPNLGLGGLGAVAMGRRTKRYWVNVSGGDVFLRRGGGMLLTSQPTALC